jgi:hypothetical protein
MKKVALVACLVATLTLSSIRLIADQAASPQGQYLGELCFNLHAIDVTTSEYLRLSISSTGSTWQLNGRYVRTLHDLGPETVSTSIGVAGVMVRDARDNRLDISLTGYDFTDSGSEFHFHAKIENSGNGTWRRTPSGFVSSISAMGCPAIF